MAAQNFPTELSDELVYEGGYSDDPRDAGGATDFGITLATYSHFLGRQATVAELQAMDDATKAAIYRAMFWNCVQGDLLPSGIDLPVFDMAVNGGPARAAKMLQEVVGAVADGMIGPATLRLVGAQNDMAALIDAYTSKRLVFYEGLSNFAAFGKGWVARIESVKLQAIALIAHPTPQGAT